MNYCSPTTGRVGPTSRFNFVSPLDGASDSRLSCYVCVVVLCKLINCENRFSGIDIVLLFHYIASYHSISKELGVYLFVAYLTS